MINCFRAVLGCKLLQGNGASIVTVVVSKTDRQAGREGKERVFQKTHGVSWQGEGEGTQTVGGTL